VVITTTLQRKPVEHRGGFVVNRFAGVVIAMVFTATAGAAERPRDKDIKQLLEQIDHERDRFEDQLDGDLKHSTIRTADRELNVERYLDDLQDNVGKLKDRFKPDYAASAEVTTVLRQGSDIQRHTVALPPNFKGASEWNRLAASLGELAAAYGTVFPLPVGGQARRLNDREVKDAAEDVARNADRYKKEIDAALKKDQTVDKAARAASVNAADSLKKDAENLASRIGDEKPASGEAQALLQHAAAIRSAAATRPSSPAAQTAWGSIEAGLVKIVQAFNLR
jgi:hypothetical protein